MIPAQLRRNRWMFWTLCLGMSFGSLLAPLPTSAEPIFTEDFSGTPSGSILGDAQYVNDYLQLTPAATNQNGSWVWQPETALAAFTMTCKVFIGGGTGADGFSFSYSEIADDQALGNSGDAIPGFAVSVETYNLNYIRLYYNNALLLEMDVDGALLRTSTWASFRISVDAAGNIKVWYANVLYCNTQLPDWDPQPDWRFGFGARTGSATDYHDIDDIVISTPSSANFTYDKSFDTFGVETYDSSGVIATGDINGDGLVDFVRPVQTRDVNMQVDDWSAMFGIDVFLSGASGDYNRVSVALDSGAFPTDGHREQFTGNDYLGALELGDIDADGDLDIVFGTGIYGVRWLENIAADGTSWASPTTIYWPNNISCFPNVKAIALGDVDQDGHLDVAAAIGEECSGSEKYLIDKGAYLIMFNQGQGQSWTELIVKRDVRGPSSIALADLQGDGRLDLVMGGWDLFWASNRSGREFNDVVSLASAYPSGTIPTSITAPLMTLADMDGDGAKDIVTSWPQQNDFTNKHLIWLPNQQEGNDSFSWNSFQICKASGTALVGGYCAIEAADLTLNGIDDLVCYETGTNEAVDLVINDGTGNFSFQSYGFLARNGFARGLGLGLSKSKGSWDNFPDIFVAGVTDGPTSSVYRLDNTTVESYEPDVSQVAALSGRTMTVAFSHPLKDAALLPTSYTVSGAGQGTLAANPTSVTQDGMTYTLTWDSGLMAGSQEIDLAVGSVVTGAQFDVPLTVSTGSTTTPVPPGLDGIEVLDARNIKVTYTTHMNDATMDATVYSISGPGQGSLASNPDTVTKLSETVFQLTWASGSMFNKAAITLAVDGDSLYSVDFIEFSDERTADSIAIAKSPLVEVGDPNPSIVNSGASVSFYVQYYVQGMPDAVINITLAPEDVLFVPSDSLPDSYSDSKSAKSIPTDEIVVTVTPDASNADRRIVTLSNLKGDGSLGILLSDATAQDDAGNPVAHMDQHSAMVVVDNTAPTLTLAHACPLEVQQYTSNFDLLVDAQGAPRITASDVVVNETHDITASIVTDPATVSTDTVATTGVVYSVVDSAGNVANPVTCEVQVEAAEVKMTMLEADGGDTSPPPGTLGYSIGGSVSLEATADRCHQFDHWDLGGASVTDNPYILTVNADVTVTPVFSEVDCRPGVEMVWPNGAEKWPMGQTVQIMWKSFSHTDPEPTAILSVIDTSRGNRATIIDSSAPDAPHALYEWVVPDTFVPSSLPQYKMKVAWTQDDTEVNDQSDETFVMDYLHDDVNYYAASLAVGGDGVQDRFDYSGDEDWFYFSATAGVAYQIETLDLGDNCDTKIEVYNNDVSYPVDPANALATNDDAGDGSLRSLVTWTAPESHLYYVRVIFGASSDFQYDFGPGTEFTAKASVSAKAGEEHVPSSTIEGVIYDGLTMLPIHRAEIQFPELGSLTFFTDDVGAFKAENLPPFQHVLEAEATGYFPVVQSILVPPGSTRTTAILLIPMDVGEGEGEGEGEEIKFLSVTTQAGAGGDVSPYGTSIVPEGSPFTVSISADDCYEIEDVLIDGVSIGAATSYTFDAVSGHHTVEASFLALPSELDPMTEVEASQGTYGDKVRVLWRTPRNAVAFQVWRATQEDFSDPQLMMDWGTGTWYDDYEVYVPNFEKEGCVPVYYYQVLAQDECGNVGTPSAVVSGFLTPPENPQESEYGPATPAFAQASDGVFQDYVRVIWSSVAEASQYFVYRSASADMSDAEMVAQVQDALVWDDYDVASWDPDNPRGCRNKGPELLYYHVVAVNNCGLSAPSAVDSGYAGEMQDPYEEALPSRVSEEGVRVAGQSETLAVRLRVEGEEAIDSATVWGRVGDGVNSYESVEWIPITDADGWVVFTPSTPWDADVTVTFEAGAQLNNGTDMESVSFDFLICADEAKALGGVLIAAPVAQDWEDVDGAVPAATEMISDAPAWDAAISPAYFVAQDKPYASLQRVWLPLPEGYAVEDLVLCCLLKEGELEVWHQAEAVAGFLDPESVLIYESEAGAFYGVAIHHGATVAFASREEAPQGAAVGGSYAAQILMLLLGLSVLLAARRQYPRAQRY